MSAGIIPVIGIKMATMLDRDEYIEQSYFFQTLGERMRNHIPIQETLASIREEVLSTTRLPIAVDFMLSELQHQGVMASAMARLDHYFSPFQAYLIAEAESDRGRFDIRIALEVLQKEARFRAEECSQQGIFLFQLETLCRNRLNYDHGLEAISEDPILDESWRDWVLQVRQQMGFSGLAEMIYLRSHYLARRRQMAGGKPPHQTLLFGEKEGQIAWANRGKDPLFLFAALQRQLGYPRVPRPRGPGQTSERVLPDILRRLEKIEARLKLLEDEQKGGIDLSSYYVHPDKTHP